MEADLVFDVGMHRGEDTAYYLAKGYRVVGFEADPDLAARCADRFAGDPRLTIVEGAIAPPAAGATVRFHRHPNSVWGTIDGARADSNAHAGRGELIELPRIDFGAVLDQHGVPAFLKVDIEGPGLLCVEALRGRDVLPDFLSIEASHESRPELERELALLAELGYDRFAVVQQATVPNSVVVTRTLAGAPLTYRFEEFSSGRFGLDLEGWTDRAAATRRLRRINRVQRAVAGPEALMRRSKLGRGLRGQAIRRIGPMPGWFDLHATRAATLRLP
jgi:FkbM family methyltransferase